MLPKQKSGDPVGVSPIFLVISIAEEQVLHLLEFGGTAGLVAAGDCTVEDVAVGIGNAASENLVPVLDLYCLHRGLVILLFHCSSFIYWVATLKIIQKLIQKLYKNLKNPLLRKTLLSEYSRHLL